MREIVNVKVRRRKGSQSAWHREESAFSLASPKPYSWKKKFPRGKAPICPRESSEIIGRDSLVSVKGKGLVVEEVGAFCLKKGAQEGNTAHEKNHTRRSGRRENP